MTSPLSMPARPSRLIVGIGEYAVAAGGADAIVTYALGSCIAVSVWDPIAGVAALLHFLLPESRINPARASLQPAAFADTGIPLLFQEAYRHGLQKKRAVVHLIGGAEIGGGDASGVMNVGRRNVIAARQVLWHNGVLIKAESVGGSQPRTVALSLKDGRVVITSGRAQLEEF
jgi:chemotaxis protein CheD